MMNNLNFFDLDFSKIIVFILSSKLIPMYVAFFDVLVRVSDLAIM